ncbi:unnamed protein product, partial [Didymodactylos carnosus]
SDSDIFSISPDRSLASAISVEENRRQELVEYLESQKDTLLDQWMSLIEEKSDPEEGIQIDTLHILLPAIIEYLDKLIEKPLQLAINTIFESTQMDSDRRADLERACYCFIKAVNSVLLNANLVPHVLFALDNLVRRAVEVMVGYIRP